MSTFNEEDRKWLYDTMQQNGVDTGNYDEFKESLNNDEDRKWYYEKSKELKLDVGTQEDFDNMMWERPEQDDDDADVFKTEAPDTSNNYVQPQFNVADVAMPQQQKDKSGLEKAVSDFVGSDNWRQKTVAVPGVNPYNGRTYGETYDQIIQDFGKNMNHPDVDPYAEARAQIMQAGITDDMNPDEADNLALNIREGYANKYAGNNAKAMVSQLPDQVPNIDQLMDGMWYNRDFQAKLSHEAQRLGLSHENYVNFYMRPQLAKALSDRYGYDVDSAKHIAGRLLSGEQHSMERVRQNEANEMMERYAEPKIQEYFDKAMRAADIKFNAARTIANPYAELATAINMYQDTDPVKVWEEIEPNILSLSRNILDENFIKEGEEHAEEEGVDFNVWLDTRIIPNLESQVMATFERMAIEREMPKNTMEFIIANVRKSLVGQLMNAALASKARRRMQDEALARTEMGQGVYKPGYGAQVVGGVAAMLPDMMYGGPFGMVAKFATKPVQGMAQALITDGMRPLLARMAQSAASGSMMLGGFESLKGGVGEVLNPSDYNDYFEGEEKKPGQVLWDEIVNIFNGKTIGRFTEGAFEHGVQSGVMGATMVGGPIGQKLSNGRGILANLAGWGTQVGVDAAGATALTAAGSIPKIISGDVTLEDLGKDFAHNVGTFAALGLNHKAKEFTSLAKGGRAWNGVEFTKKDIDTMESRFLMPLRQQITEIEGAQNRKGLIEQSSLGVDASQEQRDAVNSAGAIMYNDMMHSYAVPRELKVKVSQALGMPIPEYALKPEVLQLEKDATAKSIELGWIDAMNYDYNKPGGVADKLSKGEPLNDSELTLRLLFQDNKAYNEILKKQQAGVELTEEEQELALANNRRMDQMFREYAKSEQGRLAAEFERLNDLEPGTVARMMRDAAEGKAVESNLLNEYERMLRDYNQQLDEAEAAKQITERPDTDANDTVTEEPAEVVTEEPAEVVTEEAPKINRVEEEVPVEEREPDLTNDKTGTIQEVQLIDGRKAYVKDIDQENGLISFVDEQGRPITVTDNNGYVIDKFTEDFIAKDDRGKLMMEEKPVEDSKDGGINTAADEKPITDTDGESNQQATAISRIPVSEKGEQEWEKASVEDTVAALRETLGDDKEVSEMVDEEITDLESLLKELTAPVKAKDKKHSNMNERLKKKQAIKDAQAKLDHWKQVKEAMKPVEQPVTEEQTGTIAAGQEPEKPLVPEQTAASQQTAGQEQAPQQPVAPQQPARPAGQTAEQKVAQGVVKNNIGKRYGFQNQDGSRSEVTIEVFKGDDLVTVTRQDYDRSGKPVGEPYKQDLKLIDVGNSIVNGVIKPALSTAEKLAKVFKYTVGNVKIIDVLTEPEQQQLLDLYAKKDKDAIGNMVGELIDAHHEDLILKGRDDRNDRVNQIMNSNAGREEKLRRIRLLYNPDIVESYLSDDALYPSSAEEWVAEFNSRVPKSGEGPLAYFSYEKDGSEVVGMQAETGFGTKGGGDNKGYTPWLAPEGKGMSLQKYGELLHSQLPEAVQEQYTDQDMRNAVRDVFGGAERPSDITTMIIKRGIIQAEEAARRQEEMWIDGGPAYHKVSVDDNSFTSRLERAKQQTNAEPTDGQKKAGNYKKGHVSFGGYDFVIENAEGSTRRGKDADGKEWEQKMHNTYGYILGKRGKDGDHLDMFINDGADLDNWNGKVFVVDQRRQKLDENGKPTGEWEFDEHKIMYGFDSEAEARDAYLSNYEEGWQGLDKITGVDKDTFDKWLDSSDRKLKEFADHSIIKDAVAKTEPEKRPATAAEIEVAMRDALVHGLRNAGKDKGIDVITDAETAEKISNRSDQEFKDADTLSDVNLDYQKVEDQKTLDELNSGKTVKRYRAMQLIDGKLYPPMSAKVGGELRQPTEIGVWEQSEERPDLVKNGKFTLNKGQKGQGNVPAAYNPYFHTSTSGLNDQFTTAYKRPELVVVEVEIPESELSSGYKAEGAKDAVGDVSWHSGVVNGQLPEDRQRQVTLSRYSKVTRIVPDGEVADMIAKQLEGTNIAVPYNVVTPALRAELENRGVKISSRPAGTVTEDINGNPIRQHRVYHGSGNEFEVFDHKHMGEGAGSQTFGYGTYLTESPKISKNYANVTAKRRYKIMYPGYYGKEVFYKGQKVDLNQMNMDPVRMAYDTINSEGNVRKAIAFVERLTSYAEEQDMKDTWQEVLNVLKDSKKSDFKVKEADMTDRRFQYEVEIPDDNGENYLDWSKTLPKSQRRKIAEAVRQLEGEPQQSFVFTNYKNGWQSLADMIEREQFAYKEIHDRLLMAFGGRIKDAERVSKMMNELGFVGTKYPAGTIWGGGEGATNYVIFNEKDAKITDMIRFQKADKPIFYSNAEMALDGIKQEKGTAEQWIAMLTKAGGLKAGEDKWIGLSDWLNERKGKSVTKQEIMDYIHENQIQIEETSYAEYTDVDGNPKMQEFRKEFDELVEKYRNEEKELSKQLDSLDQEMLEKYGEGWASDLTKLSQEDRKRNLDIGSRYSVLTDNDLEQLAFADMVEQYGDDFSMAFEVNYGNGQLEPQMDMYGEQLSDAARSFLDVYEQPIESTRIDYTTEGLDNKREIALTVPTIEPYNQGDEIHFGDAGEGRAVAWARFGDTTIKRDPTKEELQERVVKLPSADQWEKVDGSNFVSKRDVYFAPGTRNQANHDYIVDKNGKFVVELSTSRKIMSSPFLKEGYDSLEEAVNAYNEWKIVNERKADSKEFTNKVLVIDEIQSKRHQDARNQGYSNTEEIKRLERKLDELIKKQKEVTEKEKAIYDEIAATDKVKAMLDKNGVLKPEYQEEYNKIVRDNEELQRLSREWAVYGQSIRATRDDITYEKNNGVPDAPFDKNWHELAMKRMLRYAAENGYDKIAWTTGEQQAERYNIGKAVRAIDAGIDQEGNRVMLIHLNEGGTVDITYDDNGNITHMNNIGKDAGLGDAKNINEIVGKEIAIGALSVQGKGTENMKTWKGDGLRIGGEGMKGFYDEMLPRFMNKYGKKWGVKVEDIDLPEIGQKMHSIDITPEMKESVMQGQPMFFKTPEGQAYGFTYQGKIYIDPRIATSETPIHEYGHLWAEMKRKTSPEEWGRIKEVLMNDKVVQPFIDKVKRDYPELDKEGMEDDFVEEVLTQYSGKHGAEKLRQVAQEIKEELGNDAMAETIAEAAIRRVKGILNDFWQGVCDMMGWQYTNAEDVADAVLRDMLNGVNPNEAIQEASDRVKTQQDVERTLMGVHNISEDKLKKVIKAGGLANPSLAVVDTKQGIHTEYGEISLIPKSSLIDSREGGNAGTYSGDAYTPTYPYVESSVTKQGEKHIKAIAQEAAGDDEVMRNHLARTINNYVEGNGDRLHYLFLKQKGLNPEVRMKTTTHSQEEFDAITKILGGPTSSMPSNITMEQSDALVDLMMGLYEKKLRDNAKNVKDQEKMEAFIQARLESYHDDLVDENGKIWFAKGDTFVYENWKDEKQRKNPEPDYYGTDVDANYRVASEGLAEEYDKWKQSLFADGDIEERLFAGFDSDGNRKYVPNTVGNASRLMNRKDTQNAYDDTGFGPTRSILLQNFKTLNEIRRHRHLIQKSEENKERTEELSSELTDIVHQISDMQRIDSNSFINMDIAARRLNEAITKKNPIRYLNNEYDYDIPEDGELAAQLSEFIDNVRNLPAKYFETKFKRPVTLDEFAIAVVPESTTQTVIDALRDAGLDVRTYSGDYKSENRTQVVMEAVQNRKDIMFQMVGKQGAAEADRAEGKTSRQDELKIAEEMEKAGKDARAIKLATNWERGKDGQWRYETVDADVDVLTPYHQEYEDLKGGRAVNPEPILKLKDLLGKDNELFKYYPDIKDMQVLFSNTMNPGTAGSTDGKTIELSNKEVNRFGDRELDNENVYGILLHEVQHVIQEKEGFAQGGSLHTATTEAGMQAIMNKKEAERRRVLREIEMNEKILNGGELKDYAELDGRTVEEERNHLERKLMGLIANYSGLTAQIDRIYKQKTVAMSDARDLYRNLAGEVEARNATERMGMSETERRNRPISSTEDVARKDQVVMMGDGTSMNIDDIKPVGTGDFGDIYDQFKGKPKEAIDFLVKKGDGDVLGVFHRDEVGDIDLVWGTSVNRYKGKGLKHIIRKHIDWLQDFKDTDELAKVLEDVVNNGVMKDNFAIEKDGYRVVIAKEDNGKRWVLTAFDNNKTKKEKASRTSLNTPSTTEGEGAVSPDAISEGKDTKNISNFQENGQENTHEELKFQKVSSLGVPYQGSKNRIGRDIVDRLPKGKRFVDLFSGGGAMTHAAMLSGKYDSFRMNDINPIGQELFMQGVRGEWKDYNRESMTDEEFKAIKGTPEALPWSFNGIGRSLAKGEEGIRKMHQQVRRVQNLESLKPFADSVETSGSDYRDVKLQPGDVVYADIPYEGTNNLGYRQGKTADQLGYKQKQFDKEAFVEWAQQQDVPVYVSEYTMPEGWTEIASFDVPGMRGGQRKEKLFVQSKFAEKAPRFQKVGGDIHSDNFKNFFGDWEKEPENASKVVDEEGKPKVVYHSYYDEGSYNSGLIFMSANKKFSEEFGDKTDAVYADIRHPYVAKDGILRDADGKEVMYEGEPATIGYLDALPDDYVAWLQKNYDGVVDEDFEFVVAFDRKQIKSATENDGTYNPENPDIRFQRVSNPEPEMTDEQRQYWKQWDADMKKWKERNALPQDAQEPGEETPMQPGESAMDYVLRIAKHRMDKALWKTAPKIEDYHTVRDDKDSIEAARENLEKYPDSPSAKARMVAAQVARLRHAMSRQKAYDKATVKAVTDFAQEYMKLGFGDNLRRGEVERLLSTVKNSTGAKDIRQQIDNVMNILTDNYLRSLDQEVQKLSSIKELRQTAQGVEHQGKLELKGQRMIQAFREARQERMTADDIRRRIGEVSEFMARNDEEAPMWEQEYEGLSIALQYSENIEASRSEYKELDDEYKDAIKNYKQSGRTYQQQQQYLDSLEKAMMENKLERIGMFGDIIGRLQGNIAESMQGAKEFVEREKERVRHIQQIANFDLAGKDMGAMREKGRGKPANFFLQPLGTFEQMLKQFGSKNANGEGYLYDYFMRTWMDSTDKAFLNEQAAKEELDAKAREVFGDKIKRWSDLYSLIRNEKDFPGLDVEVLDQEEPKTFHLTQGNLLYIYMADKMADGRMKLRKMGITEEQVAAIKEHLDGRLVELGDWLQDEYLVQKRTAYNKVHERMFGAPMATIEHYFPIRVLGDARYQEQDVSNMTDGDAVLPSTITGNIIKRRRNTLPLDILHTDALSLAIEHIEDMERWAATAEWNKDINTLLSYTTFRNKVKNMKTVYGSGDALWNTFADTARMAAGTYRQKAKPGSVDKTISNIAKGVTAAKINFRVYTAFKQILSAPAFLHDVNLADFAKNSVNPYGSWKWAMENMPVFQKRWKSRQVGDTRLMDDPTDWKMWKTNVVQMATRMGMSPNALVDGVTCAVGARSIYESRLKKYKKMGLDEAAAEKRALQDAEIGYNLTQQSSEGAFVSAIQKDRTVVANALSVFRNSSMAYTRQWVDAARNLKHRFEPGYRDESIKFMKHQLMDQFDMDEPQAEYYAEQEYARAGRHELAKMLNMMFGVTIAWNLGASLPYLLIGDDDDTKKEMMTDAMVKGLIAGPSEGFAAGNIISELVGRSIANEEVRKTFAQEGVGAAIDAGLEQAGDYKINPLPLMADIQGLISKMGYDKYQVVQDVFNIAMQSAVGVNPQTFTDMFNACMDYGAPGWDGTDYKWDSENMTRPKEIALFIMRLMNAPTSSWRNKYIDELGMGAEEAQKLSYDEMAKRYAHYKHWKDVPFMGWLRGEEGREEKMEKIRKQFDKAVQERLGRLSDDKLEKTYDNTDDAGLRKMVTKETGNRVGGKDIIGATTSKKAETKAAVDYYSKHRTGSDLMDDLQLEAFRRQLKGKVDDGSATQQEIALAKELNDAVKAIKDERDKMKPDSENKAEWENIRKMREDILKKIGDASE